MITEQDAEKIAWDWIESWNSHDLDAIMAHYADDVELTSPFVVNALGIDSGTIKGKEKLRAYFKRGLATYPELKFELSQVLAGVNSLIVYYRGIRGMMAAEMMVLNSLIVYYRGIRGMMAAEMMVLNHQGRILRVMAHYNAGSQ